MEITKLAARSHIFTFGLPEWSLNLHLIETERRNFVIDTGLGSGSAAPVLKLISQNKKPVIVINTHHHWDHVWGNCAFPAAFIISHSLCPKAIEGEWEETTVKFRNYIAGDADKRLPDLTFDKEMYFPEEGILLFHTPGHTADSISVFDERDKVLNAGDNIGDTPEEIVPCLDCSKQEYIKTLEAYKRLGFKYCVSGHNTVQGKEIADRILATL